MVQPYSATCRLDVNDPGKTFPIHENHSDMVKFSRNHPSSRVVYLKLRDISLHIDEKQSPKSINRDAGYLSNDKGHVAVSGSSDKERKPPSLEGLDISTSSYYYGNKIC
jgi:hypothetical protein